MAASAAGSAGRKRGSTRKSAPSTIWMRFTSSSHCACAEAVERLNDCSAASRPAMRRAAASITLRAWSSSMRRSSAVSPAADRGVASEMPIHEMRVSVSRNAARSSISGAAEPSAFCSALMRGAKRPRDGIGALSQLGDVECGCASLLGAREVPRIEWASGGDQLARGARRLQKRSEADVLGGPVCATLVQDADADVRRALRGTVPDHVVRDEVRQRRARTDAILRRQIDDVQRGEEEGAQAPREVRDRLPGLRVEIRHIETHAGWIGKHCREPGVQRRLRRRSLLEGVGFPRDRRRGSAREQHRDAVRVGGAAARRAHHLRLGRRRLAARDRVQRGAGAQLVPLNELMHALSREEIADGIDRRRERIELPDDRRAVTSVRLREVADAKPNFPGLPLPQQVQSVRDMLRLDRLHGLRRGRLGVPAACTPPPALRSDP